MPLKKRFLFFLLLLIFSIRCQSPGDELQIPEESLYHSLAKYQSQLYTFAKEFGGTYNLPEVDFYIFGMGNRDKYVFLKDHLIRYEDKSVVQKWEVDSCWIIPNKYSILLFTTDGKIWLKEDEEGFWKISGTKKRKLNKHGSGIYLPDFNDHHYNQILKVLHQEVLINIINSRPLPNLMVYDKPWRRDAAMMAMVLEKTGNIDLIRNWVLHLDDPYDRNNGQRQGKPEKEVDNLGQTLYLLSLFTDHDHPLVAEIMQEVIQLEISDSTGHYVSGRTDFQEVPVFQTKWLKYGLKKMDIEDDFILPETPDSYSSLFWWDYTNKHIGGNEWRNEKYPYIGWARDHFYGEKNGLISDRIYPLTWEAEASQADYERMKLVSSEFINRKIAAPHSWHAAEMFLYLIDTNTN